jgi:hypothetical protein
LTDAQLLDACPAYPEVQGLTNLAASTIDLSDNKTPATYGTAVHTKLCDTIRATPKSGLRSEVSLLKILHETGESPQEQETSYGRLGSIRIDVLESTSSSTVCVYDINTGKSGLYPGRSAEIARD